MQKIDNNSALRNLSALVDFSNLINSSLDLTFALNNILLTCFGKFHTTKGFISLYNEEGRLEVKSSKGISLDVINLFNDLPFDPACEEKYVSEIPISSTNKIK
jgi:sigma-B regulation protein RsbU (phosphoserine phosphatase)